MLGPFTLSPVDSARTGVVSVSQRTTRALDGRTLYDGPVVCRYADGRTASVVSAGIRLTPQNARLFADRAYYGGVPATLDVEEWELTQ